LKIRLLLIEDSPEDEALILRQLDKGGLEVAHERIQTEQELKERLEDGRWDAVISDFNLPQLDAFAALEVLKASGLDLPFIVVSGTVGEDVAVTCMRQGAHDYVMKANLKRLPETVRREVKEAQLRKERRSLESQIRQAQKMEAMGQLASGVAHDFNNLLTVIISFTQFVHDDLPEDHPGRQDLREVLDCGARAARLTRQLLAFSRKTAPEPQLLDLNEVISASDKMLARLLGKRIDYVTVPAAGPMLTLADRGLLEQVLVNLVVNARDAMPDGGKLTVETSVAMHDGKTCVQLAVTDNGVGMPPPVRARIFEPFFTTKGEGRGTGLGLSTVLGIVKQLRGDITVYSEEKRGTTFKVYLPRAEQPGAQEAPAAAREQRRGSETVLVVEDQASVRQAVQRALSSTGYHVLEASRAKDALAIAQARPEALHLVLTDLVLPEMDGKEMVGQLKVLKPELQVLYMSGYAGGAMFHQGVVEPGMSFIQKPFTPEMLIAKVRAALDAAPRPA
jgi:two-component system, cell cycle sensor histidine kinase and response regulator CckA